MAKDAHHAHQRATGTLSPGGIPWCVTSPGSGSGHCPQTTARLQLQAGWCLGRQGRSAAACHGRAAVRMRAAAGPCCREGGHWAPAQLCSATAGAPGLVSPANTGCCGNGKLKPMTQGGGAAPGQAGQHIIEWDQGLSGQQEGPEPCCVLPAVKEWTKCGTSKEVPAPLGQPESPCGTLPTPERAATDLSSSIHQLQLEAETWHPQVSGTDPTPTPGAGGGSPGWWPVVQEALASPHTYQQTAPPQGSGMSTPAATALVPLPQFPTAAPAAAAITAVPAGSGVGFMSPGGL